jgi:light-regulated signal transduction histidine kinase (bacteriophytochrome)
MFDFPDWQVVIVTSDVSICKRAEEGLKRSNAELEQFAYVAPPDLQNVVRAFGQHANGFENFAEAMKTIRQFWFSIVTPPPEDEHD